MKFAPDLSNFFMWPRLDQIKKWLHFWKDQGPSMNEKIDVEYTKVPFSLNFKSFDLYCSTLHISFFGCVFQL